MQTWTPPAPSARQNWRKRDALLADIDDFVLDALGIASPQEETRRVFAVKLEAFASRFDARYYAFRDVLISDFPIAQIGTLVRREPDYGLSSRAVVRVSNEQPRFIRITDFGDDGIEIGHEFVTADPADIDFEINADDILFARSGATVGKTYLHEDTSEPAIFAGYCIRFQFDKSKVSPKFVYWWTKTSAYSRWVETIQRPIRTAKHQQR